MVRDLLGGVLGEYLETIWIACGFDVSVRGVKLWDTVGATDVSADDLVLAVGLYAGDLPLVLDAAARAGAAAVVVKRPRNPAWVRSEAQRAGVTVLAAPPELPWDDLHRTITTVLPTVPTVWNPLGGMPISDLFSLADAAVAALGGPVEIDDADMCLLAYSHRDHELDELRRTSILSRQPPEAFMEWFRQSGLLRRVRATDRPVRVEPAGHHPRLVAPIRAGREFLGFVWVAEGEHELGQRQETMLAEIAKIASGRIVRLRTSGDSEHRLRAHLLRSALDGTGASAALADVLRPDDGASFRLVGFGARDGELDASLRHMLVRDIIAVTGEAKHEPGCVVTVSGNVYVLCQEDGRTLDDARAFAGEVAKQAASQLRVDVIASVGQPLSDLAELPRARGDVDRLLAMTSRDDDVRVRAAEDAWSTTLLAELRELIVGKHPHLLQGPIEWLNELDRERSTEYLDSLRCYFDAQCDLTEAARRLCVHRNTLRYRIGRIRELCGLNVYEPTERLVAELQLRLMSEY
ncbi:PucR family transcriptional regulator [Haloechinothrix salitolerans]|uniref:PucR family transcriptional regulator n=1 Tax=Haloechinothrix salitolerans TaxID=926830 RepID=A0ABW2BX34_9PSEU